MIPHSAPSIDSQELDAVNRVLRSGMLAQGREVEAFEKEAAEFLQRRHAIALSSGTAALHLALAALGVGDTDSVYIPSYACAALPNAVALQHAQWLPVDNQPSYNMDPTPIPPGSTVIVAHLFGEPAPIPAHCAVIEDIAQSIGGPTGRAGLISITSFYATKLMTTGEGGMAFTDDAGLAEAIRDLRDYDNRDDFHVRFNYKMTDIQAAMGRVQLIRLPLFIQRRREIAARYLDAFKGLPIDLPNPDNHVFFRFVISSDQRDLLQASLRHTGIDAKRPVHHPAHFFFPEASPTLFPGAERAHTRALSIPIYPSLIERDQNSVIESLLSCFS